MAPKLRFTMTAAERRVLDAMTLQEERYIELALGRRTDDPYLRAIHARGERHGPTSLPPFPCLMRGR